MRFRRFRGQPWAFGWMAVAAVAAGCGGGGGGGGGEVVPPPVSGDHTAIVLRDRLGQPIQLGSKEPYSPRETCGGCHDVDAMANAYHFQQGRTTAAGTVQTKSDFYGDNRPWLGSDGMYGKW